MNGPRILAFALVACTVCGVSRAEEAASEDGWEFKVAPYFWAMGLDGTATVGPVEAPVSVGFDGLLKSLDFAVMGELEARKGQWSLATNILYADLGKQAHLVGPLGQDLDAASIDLDMLVADAALGYRLGASPVDVLAGARLYSVDSRIEGPRQTLASGEATWLEPFIGLRLGKWFGKDERWHVGLQGDIGGFGAGSDFSWGAFAALGYRVSRTVSIHVAYDALTFDFEGEHEVTKLDTTMAGFAAAVAIRF
jgi:hypothetical protein